MGHRPDRGPGARGKRQRRYPADQYRTPYEQLVSLPGWENYLKPGITASGLRRQATRSSDTQAARQMQTAKARLFGQSRAEDFSTAAPLP